MKKKCVIFKVNDDADLSKITLMFKDKNGNNPDAIIYRNLRAVNVDDRFSTVTEFADRCRECGAKYGKLLKQQPCNDAISRQAAIDAIYARYIGGKEAVDKAPASDHYAEGIDEAVCAVEDLPPVTQQLKTGHWITSSHGFPPEPTTVCSECGFDRDFYVRSRGFDKIKYCPNCGAKMVESEVSE